MIITRLIGGLGNQMFQYAAGLALAERRRTVLKLDVSWFQHYTDYAPHNRYALSCFNIMEQFATEAEVDRARGVALTRTERWLLRLSQRLRFRQFVRRASLPGRPHHERQHRFYPDFLDAPDGTYLSGMWQSERCFESVTPLLRAHFSFRYPMAPETAALAQRIRSGPSIGVHFRRGDYAAGPAHQSRMGLVPMEYYDNAVAQLLSEVPDATLYLFSDDIEAIQREFRPTAPHVFVPAARLPHLAFDDLRLLSLCEHTIISNSTFAWWGAWLNENPRKRVIAPTPWFAERPEEAEDIVPEAWQLMAAPRIASFDSQ